MRRINVILVVVYAVLSVYVALFNWKVFTVSLATNFGFGTVNIPLVALILFVGLLFLLGQWLINNYQVLKYERDLHELRHQYDLLKKDTAMIQLKARYHEDTASLTQQMLDQLNRLESKMDTLMKVVGTTEEPVPVEPAHTGG